MSAQRYGGAHSPKSAGSERPGVTAPPPPKFRDRQASSVDVRALAMFALPTPLLLETLGNLGAEITRGIAALAAYATLMLGAWLLREGQRARQTFEARQMAKPPFPRLIAAAVLAGAGVFGAVLLARGMGDVLTAGLTGALAIGTHLAAFGVDPLKAKGVEGGAAPEHVIDAIDRAEARIADISTLAAKLRDREIEGRVDGLMASVREMLKLVEQDPRDLSRARRYFTVYLKGAQDATRKYAENHARLNDAKLRADYLSLIGELEGSFSRGRAMLLEDDRVDLEVEIEVLRERLGQESI